jgi:hypothetical protein
MAITRMKRCPRCNRVTRAVHPTEFELWRRNAPPALLDDLIAGARAAVISRAATS